MIRLIVSMLLIVGLASCGGQHREARATFNDGTAALAKGDLEQAEKLLVEARDKAGMDPDLQFRSAYNLGLVYAAQSEKAKSGEEPDLEKALSLAQTAAMWFGDASRQHEDDKDTTTNLAIVRARIQAISDELRKGEGSLEARLDAVIGEQRAVLDDARDAWVAIKETGGSDPLAQQATLANLADRERGIVAEAGTLTDLAADEIDAIGKKPEDQRSQEEKSRVVQLKNVDLLLLDARSRISEARRKLQDLAAEDGVARAEAALIALKRAREQLLDPITRLRGLAQDELSLLQETVYVNGSAGTLLEAKKAQPVPPDQVPGWMAPDKLAERQGGLRDRLEEVRAGLQAFVDSPQAAIDPRAGVVDPEAGKQVKLVERIKVALPSVTEASAAMGRARDALAGKKLTVATEEERAVLVALSHAVEQFANLKQTIELAHGDQQALIKLLGEEGAQLPTADRAKETRDALARNLARMPRIKELLTEEVTALAQKKQQLDQPPPAQPGQPAPPPPDPKQIEAAKQELAQQEQMLAQAETLRAQAETALGALEKAIAANQDPLTPAKDGGDKVTELRKLFFSVVEHLQQLVVDQGETRDQTSVLNGEDQFAREAKLPGLVGRENAHGDLGKAIGEALAAQADAANKQQGQPQPGAPDAKALAGAANEVRLANGEMAGAAGTLAHARDNKISSERLDPALESQDKAIEHLKTALQLLQPPPKGGKDKKQQQQQQQQQSDSDADKKPPQQQSGGAGQRARDEDAKRQREKRRLGSDPVDKDW